MNERILSPQLLKLVQEAGPGYSLANPEWVKKFAELIVHECASICYNSIIEYGEMHASNILYEFNIDNCRNDK